MQAEFLIRGGPVYAGLNVEAKSLPLRIGSKVFSISLAVALAVAGALAFPVNRWLIASGRGHAVIHRYHRHQ
jgi:hypothetical protein